MVCMRSRLLIISIHLHQSFTHSKVQKLLARRDLTSKHLLEAQHQLSRIEGKRGWDMQYFRDQWDRQKALQLEAINKKHLMYLEELGELLDLEERLVDAQ